MKNSEEIEKVVGEDVTKEDLRKIIELRKILSYKNSIDKIDTFAKWIFSSSSIIATLGIGFSKVYLNNFNNTGLLLFGLSIFILTIVLFITVYAITPIFFKYNPNSINSMKKIVEKKLTINRGIKIRIAGIT